MSTRIPHSVVYGDPRPLDWDVAVNRGRREQARVVGAAFGGLRDRIRRWLQPGTAEPAAGLLAGSH